MVRRFLPLSLVLLSGCAFSPPLFSPATPTEVQVPVYQPVYCTPPTLANPQLPVSALTAASLPADTIRAYAASVVLLKGAIRELNSIIQGCEEPAATSAPSGIANGAAAPSGAASSIGTSPSIGVAPPAAAFRSMARSQLMTQRRRAQPHRSRYRLAPMRLPVPRIPG